MNRVSRMLILNLGACLSAAVFADPVFVTDRLSVGLHEDKAADSPIVKVISSGTRLELIKREDTLSFVSDPEGVTGWVDNSYLLDSAPSAEQLRLISARNATLEQQLRDLRGGNAAAATGSSADLDKLSADYTELQQQFNSERLKTGELQKTITELRKRAGQDNDTDALYQQIETLRELNKDLEIQLANTLDGAPARDTGTAVSRLSTTDGNGLASYWKWIAAAAAILLVLGLCGGVYLMDLLNRRRHGGFRV